jgi:ribonuclease HI
LQNIGPPDLSSVWTIYFDGSKRIQGTGAGVVLISPQGDKLKYVLRMSFPQASNNEAKYEALLHGMKMAKACGAMMTHKYRACIVVLSINKSVEPNEEQKVLTSGFDQGFTVNTSKRVFRGIW